MGFLDHTALYAYSKDNYHRDTFESVDDIKISNSPTEVRWLNTYGFIYQEEFRKVIKNNRLDDFLINLVTEPEHRNKIIELENCLFVTIKTITHKELEFHSDQMMFIVTTNYIWSIQERHGDYFEQIRGFIASNKGLVRNKKADYLLYLIIDAFIDNYEQTYDLISKEISGLKNLQKVKPNQEFAIKVEDNKQKLFQLKKAVTSLKDAVGRIDKIEIEGFETRYFSELKEQSNSLIDDIDLDLNLLESSINLIFNIQNNRLNEVMKTLTIFSVVFIPLTFIAGVYGMNFKNMPELNTEYGYFVVLGLMVLIAILSIVIIKRKKWFD